MCWLLFIAIRNFAERSCMRIGDWMVTRVAPMLELRRALPAHSKGYRDKLLTLSIYLLAWCSFWAQNLSKIVVFEVI